MRVFSDASVVLNVFILHRSICLSPAPGQSSSSSGQAVTDAVSQQQKTASSKKSEGIQLISNKCPECLTAFSGKQELTEHFQEVKPAQTTVSFLYCYYYCHRQNLRIRTPSELQPLSSPLQSCTECSPPMLLSNSCSAAAHQRIHRSCKPHVCPECGCHVDQLLFQTHLDETCLHFVRRIGYRCGARPPTPRRALPFGAATTVPLTCLLLFASLADAPAAWWCSGD